MRLLVSLYYKNIDTMSSNNPSNNSSFKHAMSQEDAFNFMFGGNATLTVKNIVTENRFTFKIQIPKKAKKETSLQNTPYFVKVMTGRDNESDFTFIGTVWGKGNYKHSLKSTIGENAQSVQVFRYILQKLSNGTLPTNIEVWHEGRCARCGRKLTVPESIQHGFGPECNAVRLRLANTK